MSTRPEAPQDVEARILRIALVGSIAAGILAYMLLIAAKLMWEMPEFTWWHIALAPPLAIGAFNASFRMDQWFRIIVERL